jgi:DNA-binding NarL/FixJ family response regulator
VSIVDNHPKADPLLKRYIEESQRLRFGRLFEADPTGLRDTARSLGDVVLIDSLLPRNRAIQCLYLLRNVRPDLTIVMLVDKPDIASFIRYLQAGVDGVFKVPGTPESFEEVVLMAIGGWKPFPREIGKIIAEHVATRFVAPDGALLTRSEAEVLEGLVKGKRDKEIATDRGIAEGTVHSITTALFRKFQVSSRGELVEKFLPLGEAYSMVRRLSPHRSNLRNIVKASPSVHVSESRKELL